jgi:hypothetical protein
MIALAAINPEGSIDAAMLHAIHTWMSINDLADVIELRGWRQSWNEAMEYNARPKG